MLGLHWKDWCWSWNSNTLAISCEELTHWKRPWCWERLRAEGEETTENEMSGCHQHLDGHEFEWTPGVGDGQGGLACCDSWGRKELDMTEQLNWTELNIYLDSFYQYKYWQVNIKVIQCCVLTSDFSTTLKSLLGFRVKISTHTYLPTFIFYHSLR